MKKTKLYLGRNNRDFSLYQRHGYSISDIKAYLSKSYSIDINPLPALRNLLKDCDVIFTHLPCGKPDVLYKDALIIYHTTNYDGSFQSVDCQFFPVVKNPVYDLIAGGSKC